MKKTYLAVALTALCTLGSGSAWAGPGGEENPWDAAHILHNSPTVNGTSIQIAILPTVLGASFVTDLPGGGAEQEGGWMLSTGEVLGRENGAPKAFEDALFTFLPDDKTFLLRGAHFMQVRDLRSGQVRFTARIAPGQSNLTSSLNSFAVSPDGTRLAIGGKARVGRALTGRVRAFDLQSGTPLGAWKLPSNVTQVRWNSDEQLSAQSETGTKTFAIASPGGALRKTTLAGEAPHASSSRRTRPRRTKGR
jgi:WD40 repeat protein